VVTTLTPQPEKRKFKVAGGLRTFTKVAEKHQLQEVIIMAKAAKKGKKNETVTDEELEELEGLEELDELEEGLSDDEDEVEEPEDEDEDDDEDEEPAPKKGKKAKTPKEVEKKPRQSRAAADGLIGTQEAAEFVGAKDARELRMVLRKLREKDPSFAPDAETGRYQWKSLKDKQLVKVKKAFEAGLHTQIKTESLDKLKESQKEKKAAKSKDATTKTKKDKKKKKSSDDE
jgi:hypothetical protein